MQGNQAKRAKGKGKEFLSTYNNVLKNEIGLFLIVPYYLFNFLYLAWHKI